jgi:hypothetical protein
MGIDYVSLGFNIGKSLSDFTENNCHDDGNDISSSLYSSLESPWNRTSGNDLKWYS